MNSTRRPIRIKPSKDNVDKKMLTAQQVITNGSIFTITNQKVVLIINDISKNFIDPTFLYFIACIHFSPTFTIKVTISLFEETRFEERQWQKSSLKKNKTCFN